MPGDHRLTLKQACDILGKKERTVRRYVQTGLLSKTYVDGDNGWELRLSEAEVRALASGTPLPRAGDGDSPAASGAPDRERAFAEPAAQSAPAEPANGASPYVTAEGIVIAPQGEAGDLRARTAWTARRRDDPGDLRLGEAFERFFELVQRDYEAGRDAYLLGLEEIARAERSGDESAPGKGVWMLHVLRRTVGDERFWPALERFAQRHGFDRGTAVDLLSVLEAGEERPDRASDERRGRDAGAGEPLAERFAPWLRYPGLPQLNVAWRWEPETSSARLILAQTAETDGPEFYPLVTTVLFAGSRGSQSFPLTMTRAQEEFTFRLDARPRLVLVDPTHELAVVIQASKRMDEWLEQLRRGPDALHRVRAIHGLRGAWGAPEVDAALRQAVQDDPCGGVRAAAARALAPAAGSPDPGARSLERQGKVSPRRHGDTEESTEIAAQDAEPSLGAPFSVSPCLRGERTLPPAQQPGEADTEIEVAAPGGVLSVGAEVEQLKRELRRLRAEQAQIERRLLLLELRTRPRVTEAGEPRFPDGEGLPPSGRSQAGRSARCASSPPGNPGSDPGASALPEEREPNAASLPPGGPAIV
jgi:HEAT repeats